ncbi:hypothetical protein WJX74_008841 [Apatococcus lobatus]|uniref:Peptidase M28 domain-containing protein n=2 Tax=Apatococcus TaxID=904362 RepID=A0AAW1SLU1_9CHLO
MGRSTKAFEGTKLTIIYLLFSTLIYLAGHRVFWTPALPSQQNAADFSEARAFQHVQALADDIGIRLVGTPEIETAADYLLQQATAIQQLAQQQREDLEVEVALEQVSGSASMEFMQHTFYNAYQDLSNVVLRVAPKQRASAKDVLVSAHFDSTIGTSGASDCAACVGVALEVARTFVQNPALALPAPVTFLLNGGEEPILPAAHGFITQSRFVKDLGAFINLESTGPGGPDIIFQYSGAWTMEAYKRGAKYPRGTVLGQDFFDLEAIPSDTDYRMYSFKHGYGNLPGVDIATILDAEAYHTDRDASSRIRNGTLQAMGENAIGLIQEFGKVLRDDPDKAAAQNSDDQGMVFFDILGLYMVTYSKKLAFQLHQLPLVLALSMPLGARVMGVKGALGPTYLKLGLEAAAAILSLLLSLAVPAMATILRIALLGKPMLCFGKYALALGMHLPLGITGAMLPYVCRSGQSPSRIGRQLQGWILGMATLSFAMTAAGAGTGFVLAIWALSCCLTLAFGKVGSWRWFTAASIISLGPLCSLLPMLILYPGHLMGKLSLVGAPLPPPYGRFLADGILAPMLGITAATALGFWTPVIVHLLGRLRWRAVAVLLAISLLTASYAHAFHRPYTDAAPKKLFLLHFHEQAPGSLHIIRDQLHLMATDPVPVAEAISSLVLQPGMDVRALQAFFPISRLIHGATVLGLDAAGDLPRQRRYPALTSSLQLVSRSPAGQGKERLTLRLEQPKPCWGVMNVTGRVAAWSFTSDEPPSASIEGSELSYMVRFQSNHGSIWDFWIEKDAGAKIAISASAFYMEEQPAHKAVLERLPSWTAMSVGSIFYSSWSF